MKKFLLAILVDNKPGVLTHVAGLISRRAFNIESINAGYTEEESVTRINIVVSVDSERELEQVKHQLSKLIDVVKIVNLTEVDNITRELVLIKVKATAEARADLINIVKTRYSPDQSAGSEVTKLHVAEVPHAFPTPMVKSITTKSVNTWFTRQKDGNKSATTRHRLPTSLLCRALPSPQRFDKKFKFFILF